jgi:hypothetical protein
MVVIMDLKRHMNCILHTWQLNSVIFALGERILTIVQTTDGWIWIWTAQKVNFGGLGGKIYLDFPSDLYECIFQLKHINDK